MKRYGDAVPICCAVCKRQATGIGTLVGDRGWNRPTAWVCESAICLSVLRGVVRMPGKELASVEASSLAEAGDTAGDYLLRLGKTDLVDLSREEWLRFLKMILTTYEGAMRARLLELLAPESPRK